MRKCSAITFIWDNCHLCPVLWRESTMNLMFVQFLAIFSLVKISTAIADNNGWSIDNPTETFTKMYFFNCTNPQDVIDNGAKPLLKQVEYIWAVLNNFFSLKSTFRLGRTLFLSSGPKQMSLTTLIILWSTGLCLLFGFHLWLDMICRDHTCVSVHFYILSLSIVAAVLYTEFYHPWSSWPGRKKPGSLTNRSPLEAWMTRSSPSIWSPTQLPRPLAFQVSHFQLQWTV